MDLSTQSLQEFTRLLASAAPTPGGGSSAALEAALGTGLIRKVALISADKAAYAHRKDLMSRTAATAEALARDFLRWVAEDSAAYEAFLAAKHLPRYGEEAHSRYRQALDQTLRECILIPYQILQAAVQALRLGRDLAPDYYTGTASDLGLAALSLQTAAQGAHLTILMNIRARNTLVLPQWDGPEEPSGGRYQALLKDAETLAQGIYAQVRKTLS
ncbi:MAG: cyclodeaminase/cyclohydrolase family protein [Treponema sp.]|jgi:formiminotetrahydrofolate cyclodeaminase|nr:cyclodeaminase/cyclohydrolase family protein [Treponema sp.]